MNYIIAPTDNDILHYAKGTESKTHKYVSRVLKNGKWVYTYAKNRLRGNKVTNKDGKLQYAPNIKTGGPNGSHHFVVNDPNNPYQTVVRDYNVLNESLSPDMAAWGGARFDHIMRSSMNKPMVTNNTPYPYDENGNRVDKQYSPSDQAINTRTRGTAYEPTQSSKAANSRHYTPTEQKFGRYKPLSGVSLYTPVDYEAEERRINSILDEQDRNGYKVETITTKKKKKK